MSNADFSILNSIGLDLDTGAILGAESVRIWVVRV